MLGGRKEASGKVGFLERKLGSLGPLVFTVICTLAIVLLVWFMSLMTSFFYVSEVVALKDFITSSIPYISLFVLFMSYASYASKMNRKVSVLIPPAMIAASTLLFLWLITGSIMLVPIMSEGVLGTYVSYAKDVVYLISLMVLVVGYIVVIAMGLMRESFFEEESGEDTVPTGVSPVVKEKSLDDQFKEAKLTMKQAEKRYLNRKIDKLTFEKIALNYQEKMTEIEAKKSSEEGKK